MRKVYAFMDGNKLTPRELIQMLMRINGKTMRNMYPDFGFNIFSGLQRQIEKDERLRFDELYKFVQYFGGTIYVDVPMYGSTKRIELTCKDKTE